MNRLDPRGYYETLGVAPAASLEDIKRAFRLKAKECHPDKNPDPSAATQFKKLSEAYAVLSDLDGRAKYDQGAYEAPSQQARPASIEPIHCSSCQRPTAQPRHAVFWTVVSLLIVTRRTPTQGIYCAECAGKISFRCTATSAVFGWWGVWGLIWTPLSIFRNATGGERQAGSEARLLWYNALAFLSQGKLSVAHALARQVAAMKSENSLDAADLLAELHRRGVPRDTPPLIDPWKKRPGGFAAQLALGLVVPLIVVAAVYFDGQPNSTPSYSPALSSIPPVPPPVVAANIPAVATCGTAPEDGAILQGQVEDGDQGHHIEITNGSYEPAIVKVRDALTGRLRVSFFVGKGGHASVGPLPDGTYRIQYAFGDQLAEGCKSFVNLNNVSEFPAPETLQIQQREDGQYSQRISYTLYSVPNGNVQPQAIDRSKFLAE